MVSAIGYYYYLFIIFIEFEACWFIVALFGCVYFLFVVVCAFFGGLLCAFLSEAAGSLK